MIGRNGETVDSVRDLILVDPDSSRTPLAFLAVQPRELRWATKALQFRELVLAEFDRLAKRREYAGRIAAAEREAARRKALRAPIPILQVQAASVSV
jgi:hypothetical protein